MAISKVKLPDNSVEDIHDSRISSTVASSLATAVDNATVTGKIYHGTCSTAAATAAKEVTCPEFTSAALVKGVPIFVTFTATNSAAVADLTLNVNGTGAKGLKKIYNATTRSNLTSAGELRVDQTYLFVYDGTAWVCLTLNYNTTYSALSQTDADTGTSTSSRLISAKVLADTITNRIASKQDTLVSGTNIKTVNGTSILGSGNIDAEDIFWATYGTTTFEELTAAWNDGKQILCFWSNRVYNLIYVGTSFTFGYVWGTTTYRLACSASSVWSNTSDSNQSQITATGLLKGTGSGNVSAAVAGTDYQEVLVSGTNIKTINNESLLGSGNITIQGGGGSSDAVLYTAQTLTSSQQTQARTNIAAVGYNVTNTGTPVVLGLEQTTNKVTSLSSSSTDTQYPSAKCVYDYIDDTVGDIATLLAAI